MTPATLLETALDAVSRAAAVCAHVQSRLADIQSITKDDRSPVTIADFASQAVIAALLREHFGAIVLVAEESADFFRDPDHAAHLEAVVAALHDSGAWTDATPEDVIEAIDLGAGDPRGPLARADGFWTLDPVDGTKGFLRNQQYAISLSFIDEHGPRVGVLGCPNLPPDPSAPLDGAAQGGGCIFHAIRGEGAMQQHDRGHATIEIEIANPGPTLSGPSTPIRLAESVESAHSDQSVSGRVLGSLGRPTTTMRLDSQAKYAVVARGQADLYLRLPTKPGYVERIWDHAAGALIAEEAGCRVTDLCGKPLNFSHGRGLEANKGVVCAPAQLHARVLEAIRDSSGTR